jgi:hypothetical protein
VEEEAWSGAKDADFGGGVGSRRVWLLDNPDVYTIHDALGVPNIASRSKIEPRFPVNFDPRIVNPKHP